MKETRAKINEQHTCASTDARVLRILSIRQDITRISNFPVESGFPYVHDSVVVGVWSAVTVAAE